MLIKLIHLPGNLQMTPNEFLFWFCLTIALWGFYYFCSKYPPTRDFYYNKVKWQTPINRREFIFVNSILINNIQYYKNLSTNGKAKFINRLKYFITTKKFIGREGLTITEETKILISASAIQLTFGLEKFALSYFHTIFIYPSIFYSKLLRRELKGATFGGGVISLSWKDFQKGYEIPDDRYNLGLHEMAHALKIDALKGDHFDNHFALYLTEWLHAGENELSNMHKGVKSFLRAYGGKNEHEFFAVCIEHFFEVPLTFKEILPDIFKHLCILLNQNPINITKDYLLLKD